MIASSDGISTSGIGGAGRTGASAPSFSARLTYQSHQAWLSSSHGWLTSVASVSAVSDIVLPFGVFATTYVGHATRQPNIRGWKGRAGQGRRDGHTHHDRNERGADRGGAGGAVPTSQGPLA